MSVIGRMDQQVDDVLISPLARRNKQATDDQAREERITHDDKDQSKTESTSVPNRRAKQADLPVWLL
jgi:hypothetical protein